MRILAKSLSFMVYYLVKNVNKIDVIYEKIYICVLFASLIIVALGLKAKIKSDTEFSELTLSNIEALGMEETDGAKDYWCCGNEDVCAEGPHYKIKGKLKENPCK